MTRDVASARFAGPRVSTARASADVRIFSSAPFRVSYPGALEKHSGRHRDIGDIGPVVSPFLVHLFGTTAALVASLAEVLLLLYLLLASGDLFLRKLVEVLPMFREKRTAYKTYHQL